MTTHTEHDPQDQRRALVYARLSEDRQGSGENVAEQEQRAVTLARARGWQVVERYVDNDVSAKGRVRRPAFEALVAALEAGAADVVIARDLDRLLRSARDRLRMIEIGRRHGVYLAFWNGSDVDMTSSAGRLAADILGAVALHEIEAKSERQKLATRRAAMDGRRVGGRRPFGYDPDGMTVRPDEAAGVRDAFARFLAGETLGSVARALNDAGLQTGHGNPWTGNSVRLLLKNPRYAGLRGLLHVPEQGRRTVEIMGKARWPALVPEATWRAAAGQLADPRRRTAPKSSTRLLTGIARCGVCDSPVHGGRAGATEHRTIRCSGAPGHIARKADVIEDYVSAAIIARLARSGASDLLTNREAPDLAALQTQATALRQRLTDAASMFARGVVTASQMETMTAEIHAALDQAETRIADAGRVNVLGPLVGADDVAAAWEALSLDRQRAVIATLADVKICPVGRGRRTFDPTSVVITWK